MSEEYINKLRAELAKAQAKLLRYEQYVEDLQALVKAWKDKASEGKNES